MGLRESGRLAEVVSTARRAKSYHGVKEDTETLVMLRETLWLRFLQDVATSWSFTDLAQPFVHTPRRPSTAGFFQAPAKKCIDALHDRMQSPRADVFRAFVYAESKAITGVNSSFDAFGFQVTPCIAWSATTCGSVKIRNEIFHGEQLQFHTDGEAACDCDRSLGFGERACPRRTECNQFG